MRPGDLVSPFYYVELCDSMSLEELVDIFVVSDLGVLLDVVEDEIFDGPEASMCLVLNPRGKVGWVCGRHLRIEID